MAYHKNVQDLTKHRPGRKGYSPIQETKEWRMVTKDMLGNRDRFGINETRSIELTSKLLEAIGEQNNPARNWKLRLESFIEEQKLQYFSIGYRTNKRGAKEILISYLPPAKVIGSQGKRKTVA